MMGVSKLCKRCNMPEECHNGSSVCKKCIRMNKRMNSKAFGSVYFVQMANTDGYIKIGFSANVAMRLNTKTAEAVYGCFTDNPYPIKILCKTDGYVWQEMDLHKALSPANIRGEWFYPSPEVLGVIKRIQDGASLSEVLHWLGVWLPEWLLPPKK